MTSNVSISKHEKMKHFTCKYILLRYVKERDYFSIKVMKNFTQIHEKTDNYDGSQVLYRNYFLVSIL